MQSRLNIFKFSFWLSINYIPTGKLPQFLAMQSENDVTRRSKLKVKLKKTKRTIDQTVVRAGNVSFI